jgi:predicted transcriptional regulator
MIKDLLEKILNYGLSQGEISRRAGIPQPNISRVIKGRQADVLYAPGKRLESLLSELEESKQDSHP